MKTCFATALIAGALGRRLAWYGAGALGLLFTLPTPAAEPATPSALPLPAMRALADTYGRVRQLRPDAPPPEQLLLGAMNGMLRGWADGDGAVWSPEDLARQSAAASKGSRGLGWAIGVRDGHLVVEHLHPRGPAAQAGLRVGDRVIALNGQGPSLGAGQRQALTDAESLHVTVWRPSAETLLSVRLQAADLPAPTWQFQRLHVPRFVIAGEVGEVEQAEACGVVVHPAQVADHVHGQAFALGGGRLGHLSFVV